MSCTYDRILKPLARKPIMFGHAFRNHLNIISIKKIIKKLDKGYYE